MGSTTKIGWCSHTTSPWHGCQHKVLSDGTPHIGCQGCYAEAMSKRNPGTLGEWGSGGTRILSRSFHRNCELWARKAAKAGVRESVFPSICDPFEAWDGLLHDSSGDIVLICDCGNRDSSPHGGTPECSAECGRRMRPMTMDDARRDLFRTIDQHNGCLDYYLLTKRPENVLAQWPETPGMPRTLVKFDDAGQPAGFKQWDRPTQLMYRPNVYLLYSASDQFSLQDGVYPLLKCRDLVPVLGLSLEPLMGPVELTKIEAPRELNNINGGLCFDALKNNDDRYYSETPHINWAIPGCKSKGQRVGGLGEFGTEQAWWDHVAYLCDQCHEAGVAVFVKQGPRNGWVVTDMDDFPANCRFQEYPPVKGGEV